MGRNFTGLPTPKCVLAVRVGSIQGDLSFNLQRAYRHGFYYNLAFILVAERYNKHIKRTITCNICSAKVK